MNYIMRLLCSIYSSTGAIELFLLSAFLAWYFSSSLCRIMVIMSSSFHRKYIGDDWSRNNGGKGKMSNEVKCSDYTTGRKDELKDDQFTQDMQHESNKRERMKSQENQVPFTEPSRQISSISSLKLGLDSVEEAEQIELLDLVKLNKPRNGGQSSNFVISFFSNLFKHVIFCLTFPRYHYPYIHQSVLKDDEMNGVIKQVADEIASDMNCQDEKHFVQILYQQRKRAAKLLKELHSTLSDFILRLTGWFIFKFAVMVYRSILVRKRDIDVLKKASATGLPLIFLPLHRSHMDYIVITLILASHGIRVPLVAAGDNLNIPFFGWFMKGQGAFFIKRRLDPINGKRDKLYRAVLHTYMSHCLTAGHNFEFFLEGRRTRTGKPNMPKGGLLSVFIDSLYSGIITDALLIPLSINYEKLVEDSFLTELTGAKKKSENFLSTIYSLWSSLRNKHGQAHFSVSQPLSLKVLMKTLQKDTGDGSLRKVESWTSIYSTDEMDDSQRFLVDSIAKHILYESINVTTAMSTNLVSLLLLYMYRNGATLEELAAAVDVLRDDLTTKGKRLGFSGGSSDVVCQGVCLLGPGLVISERRSDGVYLKPVIKLPNVLELCYYSNVILSHFALEAIISMTVLSLTKGKTTECLHKEQVLTTSLCLANILQFEFLLDRSCQKLKDSMRETLNNMVTSGVLHLGNVKTGVCKKMHMYGRLISPLIDAYSVMAESLYALAGDPWREMDFIRHCLSEVKQKVHNNQLTYLESVSTETIANSIRLFEKLEVLEIYNNGSNKMLSINSSSHSTMDYEDLIEPLLQEIRSFQLPYNLDE